MVQHSAWKNDDLGLTSQDPRDASRPQTIFSLVGPKKPHDLWMSRTLGAGLMTAPRGAAKGIIDGAGSGTHLSVVV